MLFMLTSVSLRYFKANWYKSEYILIKNKIKPWLKKEIYNMSLWLKISFQRLKQRDKIWILIYMMTCGELNKCVRLLEKIVQLE